MRLLRKSFLGLMLLATSFWGCRDKTGGLSKDDGGILHIPFEEAVNTERSLKLSEIADSVKLILLQTDNECLLSKIIEGNILMSGHRIYIPCNNGVFLFSDDGKFIKCISKRGQGPGEYSGIRYIGVNEKLDRFYIFSHGKALVFTQDGDFLHECRIPLGWQFAFVGDSCIASFIYNNTGQKRDRVVLTDLSGDTLKRFQRTDLFTIASGLNYYIFSPHDRYFYNYEGNTRFKDVYNDTVFTVTPDSLVPYCVLQMGKYALPLEKRFECLEGDQILFEQQSAPYWRPILFEGSRWITVPYTSWQLFDYAQITRKLVMYDRSTGNCFSVKDGKVENDMGGVLPFYPTIGPNNNVLIQLWNATDILKMAEDNPDMLQDKRLKEIAEDSNPVLMIVYLQK